MLVQVGGIVTFDTRALVMKVVMLFTTIAIDVNVISRMLKFEPCCLQKIYETSSFDVGDD